MSTIRVALTDEQYAEPEQQIKTACCFYLSQLSNCRSSCYAAYACNLVIFGPLPKTLQFSQVLVTVLPADLFDKPLIQARTVYANVPALKEPLDRNLLG